MRKEKLISRRLFLQGAGLAALCLSGCASIISDIQDLLPGKKPDIQETPDITLRLAMTFSGDSMYAGGAEEMAEKVREYTMGRVALEILAGGTFGTEEEAWEAVKSGELDLCVIGGKLLEEEFPDTNVFQRPFLFDSTDEANYAMEHRTGQLMSACFSEKKLTLAGWMETGFSQIISMEEVTTAQNLVGRSVGALALPERETFWAAFNAQALTMSAAEQKQALRQGRISVCENTASVMWANFLYGEAQNLCWTNHFFGFLPLCLSENARNSLENLGEDVLLAFLRAAKEGCETQWRYLEQVTDTSVTRLKENGVYFQTMAQEEKARMLEQYLRYAEDPARGLTPSEEWLKALAEDKEAFGRL